MLLKRLIRFIWRWGRCSTDQNNDKEVDGDEGEDEANVKPTPQEKGHIDTDTSVSPDTGISSPLFFVIFFFVSSLPPTTELILPPPTQSPGIKSSHQTNSSLPPQHPSPIPIYNNKPPTSATTPTTPLATPFTAAPAVMGGGFTLPVLVGATVTNELTVVGDDPHPALVEQSSSDPLLWINVFVVAPDPDALVVWTEWMNVMVVGGAAPDLVVVGAGLMKVMVVVGAALVAVYVGVQTEAGSVKLPVAA